MKRRLWWICLPVIFVAVHACSSSGGNGTSDWTATVDTLGDTVVVQTISGSVWNDTSYLEPELTIGVFDGADEYILGGVAAVAVNSLGEIFVLDRQVPIIRKYSPDGTFLKNVGREGEGPGEYQRPASMVILPDDRLVVRDPGNGRINVYDSDSESLATWRLPSGGTFSTSRPMVADTAGNTYTMILLQHDASVTEWEYGLAKFTSAGEHTDTVLAPTWDFEEPRVTASREGSSSSNHVPFSPGTEWRFSKLGYFVGGLSTHYRIDLYRTTEPVLRIEREYTPVPVLSAERAERQERIVDNMRRMVPGWNWNGPAIPDSKPPFTDLMIDHDGRIWVTLSQEAKEIMSEAEAAEEEERTGRRPTRFRTPILYDVFETDGRYLGPLQPPEEFSDYPIPVIRGDYVWAVARDEMDVQTVVRYRIVHSRSPNNR